MRSSHSVSFVGLLRLLRQWNPGRAHAIDTDTSNGVVTISVVADNGAQSFSPNPATLPAGQTVVWRNVDNVTHRMVLDAGSLDTGNLAPGASSQPMSINAGGGPYHCSIHPSMVGTIVQGASLAR